MIRYTLLASLLFAASHAHAQSDNVTLEDFSTLMDEVGFTVEFSASTLLGVTQAEADAAINKPVRSVDDLNLFLGLARAGHRKAQRQLAIECLIEAKCPVTRKESHDGLVSAGQTDMDAAVTLAGIYRNGQWGGQAYPVDAAKWYIHAGLLGYELVGLELASLPRAVVIEAGGEKFLLPLASGERAAVTPILKPLTEIIAAKDGPFEVFTRDGATLRVGVNTSFSDVGDAASSCYVATWYGLMGFKEKLAARAGGLPESELVPVVSDAAYAKATNRDKMIIKVTYRDILSAKTNGNVTYLEQIAANFRQHSDLLHTDPGKLPTATQCDDSYLSYAGFVRSQEAADE
jgi:hypothetical protein